MRSLCIIEQTIGQLGRLIVSHVGTNSDFGEILILGLHLPCTCGEVVDIVVHEVPNEEDLVVGEIQLVVDDHTTTGDVEVIVLHDGVEHRIGIRLERIESIAILS